MISHEHKCVFIHINRTGGTSVERAFGEETDHRYAEHIFEELGDKWDDYFKFATVRNPWDRLVSIYFHQQPSQFKDFKDWVFNSKKGSVACSTSRQHKYVLINNTIAVDYLCRFENLEEDFKEVCRRIGVNLNLTKLNFSKHDHYSRYYDDETIKFVEEWHKKDIELFNYNFVKLNL